MDKDDALNELVEYLCRERGEKPRDTKDLTDRENFFRALCNVRPPEPAALKFLKIQDEYLQKKAQERGTVYVESLSYKDNIALWQGDITRLNGDGIVNACNSALLGCFQPLHNCIDNVIHSAAGVQVRLDCQDLMKGRELPNGEVKVTGAYNLPSRYIFHTVGPIVRSSQPTQQNRKDLEACYVSCLEKAAEMELDTLVFCCLSTGVYGYPKEDAAETAVSTVRKILMRLSGIKVIFNVFLEEDRDIYERILSR